MDHINADLDMRRRYASGILLLAPATPHAFNRQQKPPMSLRNTILGFTIAVTACVFMLDYATGRDIDLWLLYLVPVALGSFALGARYGYALAIFAAALLFVTAKLFGTPYPSVAAFLSERGAEAALYLVCAYLIGLVRMSIASSDGRGPIDAPSRMD